MKRTWFNPNITLPINAATYYIRLDSDTWFPIKCTYSSALNTFTAVLGAEKFLRSAVNRVSRFP